PLTNQTRLPRGLPALGALLLSLFGSCSKAAPEVADFVPSVKVFEVGKQATGQSRRISGKLLAADRSTLSFGVSGKVEEIIALQGQTVTKGQLLARLDDESLSIKLQDARSGLANSRAQLLQSQTTFNRTTELLEKRAASQKELDTATANLASMQSNMSAAEGTLKQAELNMSYTKLVAPFNGRVVEVSIQAFQELSASETAVVIHSEGALEIEVLVPETLIRHVDFGQVVQLSFPTFEGVTLDGTVIEIGAEAGAGSSFRVAVRLLEDLEGLLPGMTASVTFNYSDYLEGVQAFLIPMSAIALDAALAASSGSPKADQKSAPVFVFHQPSGTIHLRQVTFGDLRGNEVEVYSGLNDGELIVSAGVPFLRDGMKASLWSQRK
ncbi:MAG: multidrug efflux system membrane fusion protein, partial [Planctomycetota bacterium]